jgi:hypothetical protein
MKKIIVIFTIILCFVFSCNIMSQKIIIDHLSCDYLTNPIGVDKSPIFGWKIQSTHNNVDQSAYQILVADEKVLLTQDAANVWNSGKVNSHRSIMISYEGSPLQSGKKYFWKVKVWDQNNQESEWSSIAHWQMGLLSAADWGNAKWIGYQNMPESKRVVPGVSGSGDLAKNKVEKRAIIPFFRKDFYIKKNIKSATLFISGIGQYHTYINGNKIDKGFLTPGWTNYDETVFYNTYDVTSTLQEGKNVVGVIVGNGFSYINRERYRKLIIAYGYPKLICKLSVRYEDGTTEMLESDKTWKTAPSPIIFSSIYGGEDYDARRKMNGWMKPGFDDSNWQPVILVDPPGGKLKSDMDYPVMVMNTFDPVDIKPLNDSTFVYDFGQNASGIIDVKLKGEKGQQVRFIPGEALNIDGTVSQRSSGSPYYLTYTLAGKGEESWHPCFTYYGFRYVEVVGARPQDIGQEAGLPQIIQLRSLHTRNSAPRVGSFECSDTLFNETYKLINWAIKSNTQSVLTDCPHREKLGWIEQTHLMGEEIHFNFDIYHLYKNLIHNMMDAQTAQGLIPSIIPEYINFDFYDSAFRDSPEWGSAGIILPWKIYKWYGDSTVMEEAWPMMTKYFDYLKNKSKDNILYHGLGDWYDLGPKPPGYAQLTPVPLVATAMYYFDARLMSRMAGVLNKSDEQHYYEQEAVQIKEAFNQKYFNPETKVYSNGSQTAMAMPLSVDLVDKDNQQTILHMLEDSIRANDYVNTTGEIGFHFLIDALTKTGGSEMIYKMNNRDDVPGYGMQIKKGMTSLTESWQARKENSLNHLMLGHIMEWFYSGLGGIRQEDASFGYKKIVIHPEVVSDITYAKTSYQSPYGEIKTDWGKSETVFTLKVEIPVNTVATVYLPFQGDVTVLGTKDQDQAKFEYKGIKDGRMAYQIGSGNYTFTTQLANE